MVGETDIRDTDGVGSMQPFTGIHHTEQLYNQNRDGLLKSRIASTYVEVRRVTSGVLLILLYAIEALH